MHDLIPNHSFPWGCANLKWGLKGQLYQSPGLHPFFSSFFLFFFFFPFFNYCLQYKRLGPLCFQAFVVKSVLHTFHILPLKSGPVPDFSQFLTVFVYFKRVSAELQGREGKKKKKGERGIRYVVSNYWLHLLDLQYHRNQRWKRPIRSSCKPRASTVLFPTVDYLF